MTKIWSDLQFRQNGKPGLNRNPVYLHCKQQSTPSGAWRRQSQPRRTEAVSTADQAGTAGSRPGAAAAVADRAGKPAQPRFRSSGRPHAATAGHGGELCHAPEVTKTATRLNHGSAPALLQIAFSIRKRISALARKLQKEKMSSTGLPRVCGPLTVITARHQQETGALIRRHHKRHLSTATRTGACVLLNRGRTDGCEFISLTFAAAESGKRDGRGRGSMAQNRENIILKRTGKFRGNMK